MAQKRKRCYRCGLEKVSSQYHKPKSKLYGVKGESYGEHGIPVCSDCVSEIYDNFKEREDVIEYLRMLNRPFVLNLWEKTQGDKNRMASYMSKLNLKKYQTMTFEDSDGYNPYKSRDILDNIDEVPILDKLGREIVVNDEVIQRWGTDGSYTVQDYEKLEKYYVDTKLDYDIVTSVHEIMLKELAKINLKKEKALNRDDFKDFETLSNLYNKNITNAGFVPKDKKSTIEELGVTTFGQMVQKIENEEGFIPPNRIDYEHDDIDKILLYHTQWAQQFSNQQVWTETPENWRDDAAGDFEVQPDENKKDINGLGLEAEDSQLEDVLRYDYQKDEQTENDDGDENGK